MIDKKIFNNPISRLLKLKPYLLLFLLLTVFYQAATAQVTDKEIWQHYLELNKTDQYQEFMKMYPNNKYVPEAKRRVMALDDHDFEEAKSAGSGVAYYLYLLRHKEGKHRNKVYDIYKKSDLYKQKVAGHNNKIKTYEMFLTYYPSADIEPVVQKELEKIKSFLKEDDIQKMMDPFNTETVGSLSLLRTVEEILERREFKIAEKKGTKYAYESYLSKYPNGEYKKEAQRNIDNMEAIIKKRRNIKNTLLGNNSGSSEIFYLEMNENGKNYQANLYIQTDTPFGFSYGLLSYEGANEYIKGGVSWVQLSAYLSPRGGLGFYGVLGYDPALKDFIPNEDYFYSNTSSPLPQYVLQTYEVDEISISMSRINYGFGYQNTFGNLFLGVSFEWFKKRYKADGSERLSYDGLDAEVLGKSLKVKLGFSF